MPAKILRDPDDPLRPIVVYVPDKSSVARAARPKGHIGRDPKTGRAMLRAVIRPDRQIFVGLDLGQTEDWTALVAVEKCADGLTVPMISRTRGLPYPRVVASVCGLLFRPEFEGARLVVDATGVGRPVLDLLRSSGLAPLAVTFTGGNRARVGRYRATVPKRDLVNAVLLALQAGTLTISSEVEHAEELKRELAAMRAVISAAGNDRYEARSGEHDDLTCELALAVWLADRSK